MNSSNDLNTVDLLDDIDGLLFLCDRLSNRLIQVTSYVDEVKQIWLNKRRSIQSDSNMSSVIAQKASKCNKVLLNVAEKLAVVELQTESLHNLQSTTMHLLPTHTENREAHSAVQSFNNVSTRVTSLSGQTNAGLLLQQDLSSNKVRSSNAQVVNFDIHSPLHVGTNISSNTFTPKNTGTLFSETVNVKQPLEQNQTAQRPVFQRSIATQENPACNVQKSSSQHLLISQTPSKTIQNGTTHHIPQQQSSNSIASRPLLHPDNTSSALLNESNMSKKKARVKMQVIKAGTIWHNADIPIVDHPSAFFVCNQDPRVAEQFHMMSIEMNNYYNKPTNTAVALQNPSIGDFCIARFSEDNHWYRARIVLIHDDSILIVFIDYGNSETKPAKEIFPLHESYARLPAMTVACTLAESFPSNENFWTSEATEIFSMLVKNRIVEVHFQQGSGHQWPLHFVKIILDGKSIAEHTKLTQYITSVKNEQIAMYFNEKLTSMEYILYNVAVTESDIYNGSLP